MAGIGGADVRGELADQVARAALAVPGVSRLSEGPFGAVATYLPGGRVAGVALASERGEVQVVARLGYQLRDVAEEVRRAAEVIAGCPVDVTVADLDTDSTEVKDQS
ncbi:MAG: hypothetical protein QM658_09910 [Gordonia sp. (in: high G+C Gram-positive bacteria)]